MNKQKKIPGLFKKSYPPKKFHKKILKRIHIPKDREMIQNLFVETETGKLQIQSEIPQEILLKLGPLAKAIKKNKGAVSAWKAVILAVLIAIVLVFNLFFKDKTVKALLERGLEAVFKAESTVEDPQLSLLKGSFSYASLQIADADDLSRNLIETGPAVFQINMSELTRKRIHIEKTTLEGFRWDTEREIAAKERDSSLEQDREAEEDGDILDTLALTPEEMDYKGLIESQKENLKSLNLIEQGNQEIEDFKERWSERFNEKEEEIEALEKDVEALKSLDIKSVDSLEEGQEILEQINGYYPKIEETTESLKSLRQDFLEEKESITSLYGNVQSSIDDDIDYLKNLLDFSSGDYKALASAAAEKYIRARWEDYYQKGLKALEVYDRFKERQDSVKEEEKKTPVQRGGRIIPFPSPDLPDVLVKEVLLAGGHEEEGSLSSRILNFSDDPGKLDDPSTFTAIWQNEKSLISLDGIFDGRDNAEEPFYMTISSPENDMDLKEGIPSLQISRIESKAEITGVSRSYESDGIMTELDILLKDITMEQENPDGFLGTAMAEVMTGIEEVLLEADILVDRKGIRDIRVRTDLDEILAESLGEYLKGLGDDADEMIREYLTDYLKPYLEENEMLSGVMDELGVESLEQLSSVDAIEDQLDQRKEELTDKTDTILAEAEKLKAQAEQKAREEAARLQAEADRKKAEAEQRAREEAEKAAEKIKIPGF